METKDRLARLAALAGVLFVVLQLVGVAIESTGGRSMVALGDPQSKIIDSFSKPIDTGYWIGSYLEFFSLAAFAVFAVWVIRRRSGPLATAGLIAAGLYVAMTLVALVVGDALAYGSGHGLGDQSLLTLFYLQSGLFFATWVIAAAFLVLVPLSGWLRNSAVAIAVLLVIATAFPTGGASQFPNLLFLIWTVAASVALARPLRQTVRRPAWESSKAT
jgi:hypothetical protein